MATVENVVKDLSAVAPITIPQIAAAKWIDNRYKELVAKVQFRHLRKVGEFVVPGLVNTGTVTASRGSTTVTGTGTTFQTDVGSGTQEHYYIKILESWYLVASVSNETSLTLATPFSENSVASGGYELVKRTHSLNSTARWLGSFVFPRLKFRLNQMSAAELDLSFPGRILSSHYPMNFAQTGIDSTGAIKVEIYPVPAVSEIIRYIYWELPTRLLINSTIPPQIDEYVLKEGAMIDLYRYLKIDSVAAGNIDAAGLYANEEAKQNTKWGYYIRDALKTQQGVDDITLTMEYFTNHRSSVGDITNARQHVYSNWS